MPIKLKYLIVNFTIILVLFTLPVGLLYLSLPPGKLGLDKQFFKDLESDGNRIAQTFWAYHAENGRYPDGLTKVNVSLKFSSIEEWHLSSHSDDHSFQISMAPNGAGALIGRSDAPNQIEWSLTIMH